MNKKGLPICRRAWVIPVVLVSAVLINIVCLADTKAATGKETKFYLVGTGPGDLDLLTLRAVKIIEISDVIICTQSMREKFAQYIKEKKFIDSNRDLWRYYRKNPDDFKGEERLKCIENIKERIEMITKVRKAVREGKTVSILDDGDPLIYGSYGWYLDELEDLKPIVIPGLSSFNAANAVLKKCITKGSHTRSVILTCRSSSGMHETIEELSKYQATMVVFISPPLEELVEKLLTYYHPDTPIAIVSDAGYAEKTKIIKATLTTILDRVKNERPTWPNLIYIGDFLRLEYGEEPKGRD